MSKKTLSFGCFLLFILMLPNLNLYAQNTYYWYFDKKIAVNYNYTTWSIKSQKTEGETTVSKMLELKNIPTATSIKPLTPFLDRVDFASEIKPDKMGIDTDRAIPSIIMASNEEPILMSGNIVVMPKENTDLNELASKFNLRLLYKLNYGAFLFNVSTPISTLETANAVHETGLVKWCTPDFIVKIEKNGTDPLYGQQYYLNQSNNIDINAPEAWALTKGCSNIKVAVLDQGVDAHEDLNSSLLIGYTPGSNNTLGLPINPGDGHGVACAGIIAAAHDNDLGIKGISPNAKIVPVRVIGIYTTSEIATAITWSYLTTGGNADVLSNSWGFPYQNFYDSSIAQAVNNARTLGRNGKGSIVVFASGNSNQSFSGVTFPANLPGVITVGAIKRDGAIWEYSSRGSEMDLVCPSGDVNLIGDVTTTDRMGSNGYETGNYTSRFGGTSAACPQVSGAVALMLSANSNLTENEVRTILQQSATDMGASGFDNTYGYGRLNAFKAIQMALANVTISGPNQFCTTATYSVSNLPSGVTVTWSATPSSIVNISTSSNVATVTKIGNGMVNLVATLNSTCGSVNLPAKQVSVGTYSAGDFPISGQTNICSNTVSTYSVTALPGATNYNWIIPPTALANGWSIVTGQGTPVLTVITGSITTTLKLKVSNSCGESIAPANLTVNINPCFSFVASPNPASNTLNVSQNNASSQLDANTTKVGDGRINKPFSVRLFDQSSKVLKSLSSERGDDISINTSDIPNGTYFLHIFQNKEVIKKQIIIQH